MTNFQRGQAKVKDIRTKAITGYKRFSVFANATALTILVGYAGQTVLNDLHSGDHDFATVVLTVATVLVALTALVIYIKFFTDSDN